MKGDNLQGRRRIARQPSHHHTALLDGQGRCTAALAGQPGIGGTWACIGHALGVLTLQAQAFTQSSIHPGLAEDGPHLVHQGSCCRHLLSQSPCLFLLAHGWLRVVGVGCATGYAKTRVVTRVARLRVFFVAVREMTDGVLLTCARGAKSRNSRNHGAFSRNRSRNRSCNHATDEGCITCRPPRSWARRAAGRTWPGQTRRPPCTPCPSRPSSGPLAAWHRPGSTRG